VNFGCDMIRGVAEEAVQIVLAYRAQVSSAGCMKQIPVTETGPKWILGIVDPDTGILVTRN